MTSQTCVCVTDTPRENPLYNIRGFEFRAISGLGRIGGGGGLVSDFEHHHHVVHMGLGRASWQGAQGHCPPLRRPLCPSWRAGFSPIPTKSGASRASGWILGSWERRRPGPASAASRSLQKIVGAIVGAASRAGREHLHMGRRLRNVPNLYAVQLLGEFLPSPEGTLASRDLVAPISDLTKSVLESSACRRMIPGLSRQVIA